MDLYVEDSEGWEWRCQQMCVMEQFWRNLVKIWFYLWHLILLIWMNLADLMIATDFLHLSTLISCSTNSGKFRRKIRSFRDFAWARQNRNKVFGKYNFVWSKKSKYFDNKNILIWQTAWLQHPRLTSDSAGVPQQE